MPRLSAPDRSWLSAELPDDLAQQFRIRAQAAERSVSAHLRYLIREHLAATAEAPAATPGLRETATAKRGRHEES